MALKYVLEKNVVLYEIYSKKIEGDEYLCPWTVSSSTILYSVFHFQSCIFIFFYVYFSHCIERGVLYANFRFSVTFLKL
jgi:hypothetical protein